MLVNELFLKAKGDKNIRSLIVKSMLETNLKRTYMYLCINVKSKYNDKPDTVFVETDTEIRIDNYSGFGNEGMKREPNQICFHVDLNSYSPFLTTFLSAIKKTSEVKFRVVAWNGCNVWSEAKLVSHQLYGLVDDKCYFLQSYVGADNTASPVQ